MSQENPTFTKLILGRALRQQPLTNLAITNPSQPEQTNIKFFKCQTTGFASANTTFEKKIISGPVKANLRSQCYDVKGYVYFAN